MSEQPKTLTDETREWTEADYREEFRTLRKAFSRGYAAGSADATATVIRALRAMIGQLEKNLTEDSAIAAGETLPHVH